MPLPNVNIVLGNGNIGSVSLSDDGIAALVLTGAEVSDTLILNKPYTLSGSADLKKLGVTRVTTRSFMEMCQRFTSLPVRVRNCI
ncbi:hypothetical protein EZS27_015561 [termite gut metagenome]|uniref:Uncharacterized protein n=1 Tax=termite gut metagenome TaxID=433724 RepID=A0A5J4RRE2_9ZZZZ